MTQPLVINFDELTGVVCPCGIARRALTDAADFPCTIHRTSINKTAKKHYHRKLTEIYYIISCSEDAVMLLNDERIPLQPNMLLCIPPETVHCLEGEAEVLITVTPKFNPSDEFTV